MGEITVLQVTERLDNKTSRTLGQDLEERLKGQGRQFIIDLSELEFINSAGIRTFVTLEKRLSGAEGSLVLCGLDPQVREVFEVSGLSWLFSIVDSRATAMKTLGLPAIGPVSELAERLLTEAGSARTPATSPADPGPDIAALAQVVERLLASDSAGQLADSG
jgi:anti-anti-sigma factor